MADSLSTILSHLFKKCNIKAGNHSGLVSADKTLPKKSYTIFQLMMNLGHAYPKKQ